MLLDQLGVIVEWFSYSLQHYRLYTFEELIVRVWISLVWEEKDAWSVEPDKYCVEASCLLW